MGDIERQLIFVDRPEDEILDPHHFYAAYVYDRVDEREQDIQALIEQAHGLCYPIRYWWLSDAMELQGFPDRLIVCVHHPSSFENAGMDLNNALKEKEVTWDDLEAATLDEYRHLGKSVDKLEDFRSPYGNQVFSEATTNGEYLPPREEAIFMITQADIREEAQSYLGRELTMEEFNMITAKFWKALEWLDWPQYLHEVIRMCQQAGWVRPGHDEFNNILE